MNYSLDSRKGQITMFIIVGAVVLVVFVIFFSLLNIISEQELEEQRKKITESSFDASTIEYLVSVCVDDALKTGLTIIGLQGGKIYQEQLDLLALPGELPDSQESFNEWLSAAVNHESEEMVFSRRWNAAFGIAIRSENPPPVYPCLDLSNPPAFCRYPYHTDSVQFGWEKLPPLRGQGAFSIEGQLRRYMAAYVKRCVDVDELAQQEGLAAYDVTAAEGPRVKITFRTTDVIADVEYPLSIKVGGEEPIVQLLNFQTQLPVRFELIYDAIEDIAVREVSNINFDMKTNLYQSEEFFRLTPPVEVEYYEIGEHDIYIFNDTFSRIENTSYLFQLAIRNRPPALEYINKTQSPHGFYDYLIIEGDPSMVLNARAEDPDEDLVSFFYEGDLGTGTGSTFSSSAIPAPGYYQEKIIATDGSDSDWQEVNVLIDSALIPDFTIQSVVPGFQNVISREDPVLLDARATNNTKDPGANYTFQWITADVFPFYETNFECGLLYGGERCDGALPPVDEILQHNAPIGASGIVSLTATLHYSGRNQIADAVNQVEVVPCLPYRNPNEVAYPYNDGNNVFDDYLAPHACCLGNPNDPSSWRIADQSTECYRSDNICRSNRYVKFVETDRCLSGRGNICGDGDTVPDRVQATNLCGCGAAPECDGVATSYQLRPGAGWCHGQDGCRRFCEPGVFTALVDVDSDGLDSDDVCRIGACIGNEGRPCDEDFVGIFGGVCRNGQCSDVAG